MAAPNIISDNSLIPFPMGEVQPSYADEKLVKVEDLPDGSSVYQIGEEEEDELQPVDEAFHENLAEHLSGTELTRIASDLLEEINQDKASRKDWEEAYIKGIKYLGYKLDDFSKVPFATACKAFDTTLSTAHLRFYSTARAELFPATGPADFKILGTQTDELQDQGERVKEWMNYYLTEGDEEYYPDSERLLFYLGIVGSAFRKVYQDPILNKPLGRFIDPQDFIVNTECVSILSSSRLTHVLYLSKKDIKLRQLTGFYRDIEIGEEDEDEDDSSTTNAIRNLEGVSVDQYDKKALYKVYEVHTDLRLDDIDAVKQEKRDVELPLPYIVTICADTRKILRIQRNWEKDDPEFKRIQHFVQYNYLPGFGIYGIGLAQLLGSNAIVLTSVLRQLVDKGTLTNFPGGLKQKGLRIENNDKAIGPGEFVEVETGGLPIKDAIMPMPYSEPSAVLKDLRNEIIQQTQQLASTSETKIAENNINAPVGTTLAILEVANRLQSTIFGSLHKSLTTELGLFYKLFGKYLPDEPYPFKVPGKNVSIMRRDFSSRFKIIPVSDPRLATSTQKALRNEALLQTASQFAPLHDMRNVLKRYYQGLGIDDVEDILPEPKEAIALDPITENMNALEGKPLKAAVWQDHNSHIMVHEPYAQENPAMMAHIQEHRAYQYALDMQIAMNMQLPPLEELQDPEIQNAIALQAAQVVQQQQAALAEQQQAQTPNPDAVMMAQIEQQREEAILRDKAAHLKAETEAFKAQLKFESEKNKMNIERDIAEEKSETDLEIAHLKMDDRDENREREDYE
jgi:hypothetical protein